MSAADNKRLVRRYLAAMRSAEPEFPELLADDVTWWAPRSATLGGIHAGKQAVLRLMASGTGGYDLGRGVEVGTLQMVAEDDWVSVQMTLEDRYNHHFAFRVADGRICEVRERMDTLYAQQKLFS